MILTETNYIPMAKVIEKIKKVTMLKDQNNNVYKHAYITIMTVDPETLFPCQYYILRDSLNEKILLREAFDNKLDIDIFNLCGGYTFKTTNGPETRTLLPPIVEESLELDGKIYPLINDGMHRISLARLQKSKITIIYIRGASEPYYAYPLPNGWKDVQIISELNKGTVKKIHRISDNKKLYRNFDSVFFNCSTPRGTGK